MSETLYGEDAERLLADLEKTCSPEESKRRQEWARRELAKMGLIPEAKRIAELEAALTSLRWKAQAVVDAWSEYEAEAAMVALRDELAGKG